MQCAKIWQNAWHQSMEQGKKVCVNNCLPMVSMLYLAFIAFTSLHCLRLWRKTVKIHPLNFSRLSFMGLNQVSKKSLIMPCSLERFVPASSTVGSRPPSIGGGPPSVGLALQGSMSRGSFLFSVSEALEESLEPRTFTLDPGTSFKNFNILPLICEQQKGRVSQSNEDWLHITSPR